MRIVDTSAWIEWLAREIHEKTQCVAPTIMQLELAKWLAKKIGEEQADQNYQWSLTPSILPRRRKMNGILACGNRGSLFVKGKYDVSNC